MISKEDYDRGFICKGICCICKDSNNCYQYKQYKKELKNYTIIMTNTNLYDFQSLIIEINGITWKNLKGLIMNKQDFNKYIVDSSMGESGNVYGGEIYDVVCNDNFHLEIKYKNGMTSLFYKIE